MSSENEKIVLDYNSQRNVTKHSLNRVCVLLFYEEKLLHVSHDNQHQPPQVNYTPTTCQ